MSQDESPLARYRSHVADLTHALDAGDEAAFRMAFERMRELFSAGIHPELKRLAQTAQQALARFREQARIDVLATHEVPDARKRLVHVVKLTNDAAHRTLDLIERAGPQVDRWSAEASQLLEEWGTYGSRDLAALSLWPERVQEYLERSVSDGNHVRRSLSQMLLTQGYQDLAGQIIGSVAELVGELESVLTQLVSLANGDSTRPKPALKVDDLRLLERRGHGPHVPGIADAMSVDAQDDVDALIASVATGK